MNVRQEYESKLKAEVASRTRRIAHLAARRENVAVPERIQICKQIDVLEDEQESLLKRLDELRLF